MKIVIDIPDEDYNRIMASNVVDYYELKISQGTSLPKGHGELISRQDAYLYGALYADTIIPADYGAYDNKENKE